MSLIRSLLLALPLFLAGPTHAAAQGDGTWFYRGSDIAPDPAWTFGTLPNGMRYAVRRNALPAGQVSIRLRIDAGGLHEEDHEQGWAHFVEHMVFRGTENFADGEARLTWQKLGASFGSDTNATTSATQTVYQLDLPHADRASLDTSLRLLSEMADKAKLDPGIVEAERKVVLAEKGRQSEIGRRFMETSKPLFYAGLKYASRDVIGTDATLGGATAQGLRAFYERWYRPERATIVMVGDADPAMMETLIADRFGGWRGEGPAPAEPDFGAIISPKERAATLAYPGAPTLASVLWLRPYEAKPNTVEREKADLATSLAERIVNRRLEARARSGEAAYIGASAGESRSTHIAEATQIQITARDGKWREALAETFSYVADALRAPPSQAEIAREIANLRIAATSAVEGETTVKSQQRAGQMVAALDGNSIVTTAATSLELVDRLSPEMTPALVGDAMKAMFEGSGPRLMLLSPAPIEGGAGAAHEALAAAERAAPAIRQDDRTVGMDSLPALGPPGEEVSRERIEDMDVTIVRFANGSTLTFKRTDYEKGSVGVQLRFGSGTAGFAADRPSLAWLSGVVWPSGLADLDLDALERLLTGRRMAMSFGVGDDALVLRGATNGTDLADQLRLLATKLAYPRWDEKMFARLKANALDGYDLAFASASARAGREMPGFLLGGDRRFLPVEKEAITATTMADFRTFFEPLLAAGPIEAVIVGDVDLETVVNAMKASIAALPARPAAPPVQSGVRPPSPSPEPVRFAHDGDPDQAFGLIGWSTFGGKEKRREQRALALAANMLRVRLYERLREAEGASYSPSASSSSSQVFEHWGIFQAAAEVKPASIDTFLRIAREEVASLAAKPVAADEFERAINPVISGIERRLVTNAYWIGAMEDWARDPGLIEHARTYLSDFKAMTAEEVRAAVATYVAEAPDWSMVVLPAKTKAQ